MEKMSVSLVGSVNFSIFGDQILNTHGNAHGKPKGKVNGVTWDANMLLNTVLQERPPLPFQSSVMCGLSKETVAPEQKPFRMKEST